MRGQRIIEVNAVKRKKEVVMSEVGSLKMLSGTCIPTFGLGTWQSKPGEVEAAVEVALRAGYRHLDCAHIYQNEAEIGQALQKCFKDGVCKREELFVTSKLWPGDMEDKYVLPALQLTLKNLQLDYLDLYLIHSPFAFCHGVSFANLKEEDKLGYDESRVSGIWKAMEDVMEKGLTRAIGISNFTITKTEALLKTAKIVPAVNQVECHPYFQQKKLREYCNSKGILIEAYAPLGSPSRGFAEATDPVVMEDPIIQEIAAKKGVTPAQICIAFLLRQGFVVIPKSVNPHRIQENFEATKVSLSQEEVELLVGIDKNCRLFKLFLPKAVTLEEAFDIEADEKFVVQKK